MNILFIVALSMVKVAALKLKEQLYRYTAEPPWFGGNLELFRRHDCGFHLDCPLDYKIADVEEMATRQQNDNISDARVLQDTHEQARALCHNENYINTHGGWCYNSTKNTKVIHAGNHSDANYSLSAGHVEADFGFVSALLMNVLLKEGVDSVSSPPSISDFGAGVGQFGHALRARLPDLEYYGYDGAGNVEEFTENYIHFIDLTQPLNLRRTDWVLSSEVGEHIPHSFEKQVIANIHAHNCKGVILTWAILNQNGKGHINNHSNSYLIQIFEGLGYKHNEELSKILRDATTEKSFWLKRSTMVFERLLQPAGC